MRDIVFVLAIVLFFAIAIGYTHFCDRMELRVELPVYRQR